MASPQESNAYLLKQIGPSEDVLRIIVGDSMATQGQLDRLSVAIMRQTDGVGSPITAYSTGFLQNDNGPCRSDQPAQVAGAVELGSTNEYHIPAWDTFRWTVPVASRTLDLKSGQIGSDGSIQSYKMHPQGWTGDSGVPLWWQNGETDGIGIRIMTLTRDSLWYSNTCVFTDGRTNGPTLKDSVGSDYVRTMQGGMRPSYLSPGGGAAVLNMPNAWTPDFLLTAANVLGGISNADSRGIMVCDSSRSFAQIGDGSTELGACFMSPLIFKANRATDGSDSAEWIGGSMFLVFAGNSQGTETLSSSILPTDSFFKTAPVEWWTQHLSLYKLDAPGVPWESRKVIVEVIVDMAEWTTNTRPGAMGPGDVPETYRDHFMRLLDLWDDILSSLGFTHQPILNIRLLWMHQSGSGWIGGGTEAESIVALEESIVGGAFMAASSRNRIAVLNPGQRQSWMFYYTPPGSTINDIPGATEYLTGEGEAAVGDLQTVFSDTDKLHPGLDAAPLNTDFLARQWKAIISESEFPMLAPTDFISLVDGHGKDQSGGSRNGEVVNGSAPPIRVLGDKALELSIGPVLQVEAGPDMAAALSGGDWTFLTLGQYVSSPAGAIYALAARDSDALASESLNTNFSSRRPFYFVRTDVGSVNEQSDLEQQVDPGLRYLYATVYDATGLSAVGWHITDEQVRGVDDIVETVGNLASIPGTVNGSTFYTVAGRKRGSLGAPTYEGLADIYHLVAGIVPRKITKQEFIDFAGFRDGEGGIRMRGPVFPEGIRHRTNPMGGPGRTAYRQRG